MLTLNQIIDQIKTLANAHYQIAEVGVGTIAELQAKPDRDYPLLWLSNEGGTLEDNYKVDNIRLTMFGRVIVGEEGQDDDASEIEVLSDMQLILLDFLNYFHQQHGQEYVTDKSASLEHFTERTNDRTAGYSTVLELKQFYDWNKCQIPESGASIPPTIDGLTLYDFCDQSVLDRLTPTQNACLAAEFGANINVRNQDNDWSVSLNADYTLPYLRVVDSDGSNIDTVDYKPVADGVAFTCTPASYGTRILSLLRREYCVDALMGFSFRYIDDEWANASNAVCRIRRSSDNAEQDFTADEITDGTLTTFTGAGDGHVVKWYDQTGNYFELFNNTAGNQAKLVTSGVLNTDTSGNPTCITTSTFGYEIGANGGNSSRLTLFSPSGAFWAVGTKNNSTSISRCISNAGNPAVGIADTTSFQNANGTGNPIAIVNGSALANDQRTTLQTAINNVEHALFMHTCQWTASGNWRTHQGILAFQAYPVGSQISEFVLDKKDWSGAALVSLINSDLQTYYGYW